MSFGWSAGDILAVIQLAWNVYSSYHDAPENLGNISQEVLSLHAVLDQLKEVYAGHTLSSSRQANLATIVEGCCDILKKLDALMKKYLSMGAWHGLKWGTEDISQLRARLTSNTTLLSASLRLVVIRSSDTLFPVPGRLNN